MSVKKLDFPLQGLMAEDNTAMSTKFQEKMCPQHITSH